MFEKSIVKFLDDEWSRSHIGLTLEDIEVSEGVIWTDEGTETSPEPPIISRGSVWTSFLGRGSLCNTGVGPSPRRRCGTPVNLPSTAYEKASTLIGEEEM
jgi:hypothetical protein